MVLQRVRANEGVGEKERERERERMGEIKQGDKRGVKRRNRNVR